MKKVIRGLAKPDLLEMEWTNNPKKLMEVVERFGWTRAHKQVEHGWTTEDPEILRLATKYGWTVAHHQAALLGWTTNNATILRLARYDGWTVAHEQASHGWTTEDPEILRLTNRRGYTVAHQQVVKGWTTDNTEILRLATDDGWTVAEAQAAGPWIGRKIYVREETGKTKIQRTFRRLRARDAAAWFSYVGDHDDQRTELGITARTTDIEVRAIVDDLIDRFMNGVRAMTFMNGVGVQESLEGYLFVLRDELKGVKS